MFTLRALIGLMFYPRLERCLTVTGEEYTWKKNRLKIKAVGFLNIIDRFTNLAESKLKLKDLEAV